MRILLARLSGYYILLAAAAGASGASMAALPAEWLLEVVALCSFDSVWLNGYSLQRSPALLRRLGRLRGGEFSVGLRSCCSSSATDSQPNRLCPLCVPNACAGKGERLRSHWGSCSWSSAEGCHRPSIAGGSREQLKACWFVVQVRPARARATRVSSAGVA